MNTVTQIKKTLELNAMSYPGGMTIATKNVIRNGDYASVCFLSNVKAFSDNAIFDVVGSMRKEFNNSEAVKQVKAFILSINDTIRFTDEPNAPVIAAKELDLYSKEQLRTAMRRVDSYRERVTDFDRTVLSWAEKKGFVVSSSYTQIYYTNLGSDWI